METVKRPVMPPEDGGIKPALAQRTMKARGESVCPRCHMMIHVGQRIGLTDSGWLHIRCVLGFRPPMIGWTSGA